MTLISNIVGELSPRGISVPRRFAAIDFDSRHIHIVCAEREGKSVRIVGLSNVEIPDEVDLSDPDAIGKVLARALRAIGGIKAIMMNIPRSQAVLKPLRLPPGTEEEDMPNMVRFQVEKELPFRIEDAVVDFTISHHYDALAETQTPIDQAETEILAAAVRLPVVQHYRQIAETAGVKLLRLALRSHANLRCVGQCLGGESTSPVAIVHVTADETEIDVMSESSMGFSRSALINIPTGASDATMEQTARDVAAEAVRTLHTYQAASRGEGIDRILLAGATGIEPLVAKTIPQRLSVRCERFNPASALRLPDDGEASAYISALGLALGADGAALPMDFVNPKQPQVKRDPKKVLRVRLAAAAGVVLLVVVAAWGTHLRSRYVQIDQLRGTLSKLKETSEKIKPLKKRFKNTNLWVDGKPNILDHIVVLSSSLPSCKDMYLMRMKSTSEGWLDLAVRAKEASVITDMGRRLQKDGYKFTIGKVVTTNDTLGYLYETRIRVMMGKPNRIDLASIKRPARPADDASLDSSALHYVKTVTPNKPDAPNRASGDPKRENNNPSSSGRRRTRRPSSRDRRSRR